MEYKVLHATETAHLFYHTCTILQRRWWLSTWGDRWDSKWSQWVPWSCLSSAKACSLATQGSSLTAVLWVWCNHSPVSVQTTQPEAPFSCWQGVHLKPLRCVNPRTGKKLALLETWGKDCGSLGDVRFRWCPHLRQAAFTGRKLTLKYLILATALSHLKARYFNEMARWWKCCNAFFVAAVPQTV